MSKTVKNRVVQLLQSGQNTSVSQIERLGVANVRATIADLRAEGYVIYSNKVAGKTMYRLGKPTKAMVALAYSVAGASIFQQE